MSLMSLIYSAAAAMLLSAALVPGCRRLASWVGAVARPHRDRWRSRPVTLLGGGAIYLAVVIVELALLPLRGSAMGVLLAGASLLFALGLLDDLRPLSPTTKVAVQLVVAIFWARQGLQLGLTGNELLDAAVTVVWVVGIVNAINLLDNMDGLAAGIAIIAGVVRIALFSMDGNGDEAVAAAIFVGAVAGFLCHNWHPASIFMGDAGSLFVGGYLAGLNLIGDWPYSRGTASVLVVPVLILLVPIFDTTWVTVTRRLGRRPIARGGRDHVSHHLVLLGLTERWAVTVLYLLAVGSGLLALMSYRFGLSRTAVLIVFAVIALVVFGVRLAATSPARDEAETSTPESARINERA